MRERAQRIGARFKVWSRHDAGTEVELSIPNHVAFRAPKDCESRHMSDKPKIRVFGVDDHPLLREGIAAIINSQPDMVLVAQRRPAARRFRAFGNINRTSP